MPPKAKPKPKPKQTLTDALEQATLSSPAGGDISMPDPTPKRRSRTYKSSAVVDSDDDFEPVNADSVDSSSKKRSAPAVTIKKHKIKPDDPFRSDDVLEISDSDFVVSDEDHFNAAEGGKEKRVEQDDFEGSVSDSIAADNDGVHDTDEDSKLVGGDTMYSGPDASSLRIRLKRPAPTTPPYGTRASIAVPDTPDRSPTKKHRSGPASIPPTPSPEKRNKRSAFPKSDVASDASDFEGSGLSKPFSLKAGRGDDVSVRNKVGKVKPSVEESVDSIDESDMPGSFNANTSVSSKVQFHDDDKFLRIKSLPDECEITVVDAMDSWLKDKGYYEDLPNLREVVLAPIRDSDGDGLVLFSSWRDYIPNMPMKQLLRAILFTRDGRFLNPSRVDPLSISARPTAAWSDSRWELATGGNVTAVCVSPVMIMDSYTSRFNPALSFSGHYISAVFHSYEFNRMISLLGMVVNEPVIHAQVWRDTITIGNKTQKMSKDSSSGGNAFPKMFVSAGSPIKSSKNIRPVNTAINAIEPLSFDEKIPVYDGVNKKFDMSAEVLGNLDKHFERFEGEMPPRSCAVVGYISQLHKHNPSGYRLYTYARWVIVLAVGR
ncbi:hypothetical protein CPC08DRAFT_728167 [Agrocybe pediades]|nr:hypothetical protein CPC08DRAFT_728167 [Agrocybe pediades]